VSLSRSDNPEDFSEYGTCIKVGFRNDEKMLDKMKDLTAWQQRNGRKSVATILYMIALKEMTKCPFRVVDETNQVNKIDFNLNLNKN
jgi:structural maintenance of chromosomes protein 5